MPAKNSIKQFVENSYYHIYNRGVEKRLIFIDEKDYVVFLSYLKEYLLPKNELGLREELTNANSSPEQKAYAIKMLRMNNFADTIQLLAYCLMPNHFHLLVKQSLPTSIDSLMNSLCTRYSMYFNRRHKRIGHLFQGTYKAVLVQSEAQLLHLSRYIHKNPFLKGVPLQSYSYSSYSDYLGKTNTQWVEPSDIMNNFASSEFNSYQNFVESVDDANSIDFVKELILD